MTDYPKEREQAMRTENEATRLRKLVDQLGTELILLRAAWVLVGDDDRCRKALYVSPSDVKRWSKLIRKAGRSSSEGTR